MWKIDFKKLVVLLLIFTNLFGAFTLPTDCYLAFSDTIEAKTNIEFSAIEPNISIPDYLYNYKITSEKHYANYFFTFESEDDIFKSKDSLYLVLPAVGSVDICYLNGEKIGQTGSFPPHYQSAFCKRRLYNIPDRLIMSKNILQILVYSQDKNGGILKDLPTIFTSSELKDIRNNISTENDNILMPFSNGISVANFDKKNVHFNNFYPNIYNQYNNNQRTEILLQKLVPIVYQNSTAVDLSHYESKTKYIEGTGIIEHKISLDKNSVSIIGFCPYSEQEALWVFYIIIEGANLEKFNADFQIDKKSPELRINKDAFVSDNKKWVRLILHFPDVETDAFSLTKYKNINKDFALLIKELKWWQEWHNVEDIQKNLSRVQLSTYLQSLVMLKMSQSREDFPVRGQIVSSLPPGNNRVNLLDQNLAIEALLISKHHQEALNCLQFLFHGRCGNYRNYNLFGNNVGLLNNYCLSVNDYFSNGTEKEINPENAVISLAGFGLTLSNIRHYIEETKDYQFIEYYWEKIYKEIALVLINLIDETGLIRKDSGFFEDALPGNHYVYTSALIYNGLVDVAWLARLMTQETAAQEMEFYANKIRLSIQNRHYNPQTHTVRGTLEGRTKDIYIDATISSLTNYIFTSQDNITYDVINTLENNLSCQRIPLIYSRYSYNFLDKEISTFLNINFAESYYRVNENEKGDDIINYLIELSESHAGILSQNIDPIFNHFTGCYSTRAQSGLIKALQSRK